MTQSTNNRRGAALPLPQRAQENAIFAACVIGIALVATGLLIVSLADLGPPITELHVPIWLIAVGFLLAARLTITEQIAGTIHVFSALEVPLVFAMFSTRPTHAVAACAAGNAAVRLLQRRQPLGRFAFGLALNVFEVAASLALFRALVDDALILHTSTWLTALAVVLGVRLLRTVLVIGVVQASGGWIERRQATSSLALALGACVSVTSAALVAVMVATQSRLAMGLVAVFCAVPLLAYHAYVQLQGKYARLRLLQEFTAGLSRSTDLAQVVSSVLDRTRRVMRTERSEILLFAVDSTVSTHESLGGDGLSVTVPSVGDWLWERVVDERRPIVCPERANDSLASVYLTMVQSRDLVAAPLVHGGDLLGVLLVRDRLAELPTFSPDDCDLFATMADQTATALHAARLADRVRSEEAEKVKVAAHDALTGLPNRASFNLALDALSRSVPADSTATTAAVLSLDLNRFKEVNAVLGHTTGDALIVGVAQRVRQAVPAEATVARLGGDELAVLIPGITTREEAVALADRVQEAVRVEFAIDDLTVTTDAAIGIALLPDHGRDHITLMRRADVAMYIAKEQREGAVSVFDPAQEVASNRQISLVRDLRSAIDNGELSVHYQPKGDMVSGDIVGVEALVRWVHPTLGSIAPDEFIGLAEHAGLVQGLTDVVLAQALQQCRSWHDRGLALHVAVNLSARSLREIRLATRVQNALDTAGVSPDWLTLEITEGEFVQDGPIARRSLRQLHDIGVQLSIDDFGTGYSSLSYLARLICDEVKIDKSFVTNVAEDDVSSAIVRAVIELAGRLGLRTVAEGVEDQRTWDRLSELGVDIGQGYYLSKPVPADTLSMWLWERRRAGKAAPAVVPVSNVRAFPRR